MSLAAVTVAITAAALQPSVWVSAEFVPSVQLDVAFPDSGKRVQLGNFITPEEGAGALLVKIHAEDSAQLYTLISLDPDAPSRVNPIAGPWLHGISGNLTVKGGQVVYGEEALTPWVGPGPPVATGDHRYTFLLYRQPTGTSLHPLSKQKSPKSNERIDRRNFDCPTFVQDNGLVLVGVQFFMSANANQVAVAKA